MDIRYIYIYFVIYHFVEKRTKYCYQLKDLCFQLCLPFTLELGINQKKQFGKTVGIKEG